MVKKIILGIGIAFLLGFCFTSYYLFNNAEKIANDVVRNEFIKKYNESNSSQYEISIGTIKLNIFTGSFKLRDIVVTPKDSLIVLEKNLDGKAISNTYFKISISEIKLSGFDIIDAINNRYVNANVFEVNSPKVDIYHYSENPEIEKQPQDTLDLRTIFLTNYDSFNLDELYLHDIHASIHVINARNDTSKLFSIHNLDQKVYSVKADRESLFSDKLIEVGSYNINSKNIEVDLGQKATIELSSLHFNSDEKDLLIKNFSFLPNSKPSDFLQSLKYKKGWVNFKAKEISISNIDIIHWYQAQELFANSIKVIEPQINVFNKVSVPFDPKENKPMLRELILAIPIPVKIESARIENAKINIDIDGKTAKNHGKLHFQSMNIEASNITNIPEQISKNGKMTAHINTKINKTGNINAYINIDLSNKQGVTMFNVQASKIELPKFNSVLKPILRISLTSGEMVSLKINSTISNNGAFGTMDAHYTKLKLQLESKDLEKKPGFFNNVASGIANGILKTENNPESPDYHQGKFRFKRTQHDNFFKMLWLVTMHGLEDSILGSNSKEEKQKRKKEKKSKPKKKIFNFK